MSRRTILVLLAIFGGFLVLLGGYYFGHYRPYQQWQQFSKAYFSGLAAHKTGDLESAVDTLTTAADQALTPQKEVNTVILLAYDLFRRNMGDDRIRAAEMYKDIIEDERRYAPRERAVAIDYLLNSYLAVGGQTLAREHIFTGSLAEYIHGKSVQDAVIELYKKGDSLYPLPSTGLRLANIYGARMYATTSPAAVKKNLDAAIYWADKGEAAIPANLTLFNDPTAHAVWYRLLGSARRAIADFTDKDYTKAKAAFDTALGYLRDEENAYGGPTIDSVIGSLYLRTSYAGMIASTGAGAARVREMILPALGIPAQFSDYPFTYYDYLRQYRTASSATNRHKQDITLIARLVPEYKTFVKEHGGWTDADFK